MQVVRSWHDCAAVAEGVDMFMFSVQPALHNTLLTTRNITTSFLSNRHTVLCVSHLMSTYTAIHSLIRLDKHSASFMALSAASLPFSYTGGVYGFSFTQACLSTHERRRNNVLYHDRFGMMDTDENKEMEMDMDRHGITDTGYKIQARDERSRRFQMGWAAQVYYMQASAASVLWRIAQ